MYLKGGRLECTNLMLRRNDVLVQEVDGEHAVVKGVATDQDEQG